jgi:ABC-type branched-subunit amino acid transport system ATPase component
MEVLLEARGIVKQFGGLAAVSGVDLAIRRGEILGVIGPNGAGKTTLVNCISGLDKPTSGTIVWKGQDITRTPGHIIGRLGIARTFQVVKPLKQMTVRDNVAVGAMFGHGGARRSTAEARRHAEEIIARLGLAHRMDHRASELTIADLKRLELAKALAMDPELLLLDEVMAGLNQSEVELAMQLIQTINRSGVTLYVIEHVMKAIMGISHRVLVLHHGRKIAEGDPREVIENPEVVEAYLGERFAKRERERGRGPGDRPDPERPT